MRRGARGRRRRRLLSLPLSEERRALLTSLVPPYRRMPDGMRRELEGLVQVFLAEKRFEGCGGLEISEEMRVAIAGFACILLLGRPTDFYRRLISILVYPTAFHVRSEIPMGSHVAVEARDTHLGESWEYGTLVLSWDEVLSATLGNDFTQNLVYHEFAHQLDLENGAEDGVPGLRDRALAREWASVLRREYEELRIEAERGDETFLDPYGLEHPAEFFAVATEAYFLDPKGMRRDHPELFRVMNAYFRVDPTPWAG